MENACERIYTLLGGKGMQRDVPLSELTSFRIGGPAALVFRPDSEESLLRVLALCGELACPYRILGNGTNILAPDAGFAGIIIRLDRPWRAPEMQGSELVCHGASATAAVARFALEAGFSGFEPLSGIPGSIGGGIAMNAGAYNTEIADLLVSLRVLSGREITEKRVKRSEFGTRSSAYCAPGRIVLGARFALAPDDGGGCARMAEYRRRRSEKQPLDYPSAGSVFKRPKGFYAGGLIESCGLKGERVGGAEVSTLHAGFIINTGNATEHDVRTLIDRVTERVHAETGVWLERELKLLCEV